MVLPTRPVELRVRLEVEVRARIDALCALQKTPQSREAWLREAVFDKLWRDEPQAQAEGLLAVPATTRRISRP